MWMGGWRHVQSIRDGLRNGDRAHVCRTLPATLTQTLPLVVVVVRVLSTGFLTDD